MKKFIVVFTALLFVSGCFEEQRRAEEQRRQDERAALVWMFQRTYPDNWQQKLFEYDIEQNRIAQAAQLQRQMHREQMYQQQQTLDAVEKLRREAEWNQMVNQGQRLVDQQNQQNQH
jgi:hypothetical protein